MTRPLLASLVLCASASAQTAVVSPDPVFAFSEGPSATTTFGAYAAGRYQIADGNLRSSAAGLKSLSVRHDHFEYTELNGMGRTYRDARLEMAECTQPLSGSFAANARTTPTRVFSGASSWPIQLGPPAKVPAPFTVVFPFATTWSYSGVRDLLADFRLTSGALSNSSPWSGSTAVPYRLDSFGVGSFSISPAVTIGNVNGGCVDGNASSPAGATVRLASYSFGPSYSDPTRRNKLYLEAQGSNFGVNATGFLALAFGSDVNGLPFPLVTCNRIHLDARRTWFLYPLRADSVGRIPPFHFGLPNGLTTYDARLAGAPMTVQGVWADTKSAATKLSSASRISLVALPFATSAAVKMSTVYDPDPNRANASFGGTGVSALIPILRYGR